MPAWEGGAHRQQPPQGCWMRPFGWRTGQTSDLAALWDIWKGCFVPFPEFLDAVAPSAKLQGFSARCSAAPHHGSPSSRLHQRFVQQGSIPQTLVSCGGLASPPGRGLCATEMSVRHRLRVLQQALCQYWAFEESWVQWAALQRRGQHTAQRWLRRLGLCSCACPGQDAGKPTSPGAKQKPLRCPLTQAAPAEP